MPRSMSRRWPTSTIAGSGRVRADEEPRRRLHRPHRRGEPDALEPGGPAARFGHRALEPLERERQVRAALVARHRVDLVHDDGAHIGEPAPARFRR